MQCEEALACQHRATSQAHYGQPRREDAGQTGARRLFLPAGGVGASQSGLDLDQVPSMLFI